MIPRDSQKGLTQARLKELLTYCTETGVFTRNRAGRAPGALNSDGYLQICVDRHAYMAHRLAWLYVNGEWPSEYLDHINGDRTDNRIQNLRAVSHAQNMRNLRKPRANNKLGVLGVMRSGRGRKRYLSHIWTNGKSHFLGSFATPEAAHQAYVEAKRKEHDACTL